MGAPPSPLREGRNVRNRALTTHSESIPQVSGWARQGIFCDSACPTPKNLLLRSDFLTLPQGEGVRLCYPRLTLSKGGINDLAFAFCAAIAESVARYIRP